jgi:signal peptidase II
VNNRCYACVFLKVFSGAGLFFLIDRITKWWALQSLNGTTHSVCYGCNLGILWNRGVSLSLFSSYSPLGFWLLSSVIASIICFFMFYALRRALQGQSVFWETLILGGALSNFVDRIYYGAVLDFIELYAGSYHFPVFNVADVFIVFGVGVLILKSWGSRHECNH